MFDRYLDARRRRPVLLYAAFGFSVLFQASVISGLLVRGLLHVPELEAPHLWVHLSRFLPPPLDQPPGPRPSGAEKVRRGDPKPRKELTQPHPEPQPAPATPEPDDNGGGDPDGDPDAPTGPPSKGPPGVPPGPHGPPSGDGGEQRKLVPAFVVRKDRLGGELPHLPEVIRSQRRGSTVLGSYKLCIGRDGRIDQVAAVSGIPGADEVILAMLATWTYKPQRYPVCFIEAFQFLIE